MAVIDRPAFRAGQRLPVIESKRRLQPAAKVLPVFDSAIPNKSPDANRAL